MKQLLNNKVIKIDILKEFVESVLRSAKKASMRVCRAATAGRPRLCR